MTVVRQIAEGAVLAMGQIASHDHPLLPEESQLADGVGIARFRELRSGRSLARIALKELGLKSAPILSGAHGEPLWPAGVCGSISHTALHVAALAANTNAYKAVGIDVNDGRALGSELEARVMDATEEHQLRDQFAGLNADPGNLAFSAKEAFFKCQFRLTRLVDLRFEDIRLSTPLSNGCLSVTCSPVETILKTQLVDRIKLYPQLIEGQLTVIALWKQ